MTEIKYEIIGEGGYKIVKDGSWVVLDASGEFVGDFRRRRDAEMFVRILVREAARHNIFAG